MEKAYQSWSLFIFCYNEAGNIERVARDCLEVLKVLNPHEHELIIVDDGSDDGTQQIIEGIARLFPQVVPIFHPKNLGIGHALHSGYRHARFENVCGVPGDGQFAVKQLLQYPVIPADTVLAFYRAHNLQYSLVRETLTTLNWLANRLLLGLKMRDVNWVKVYKTANLREIPIRLTSSLVESEICAKLNLLGKHFMEVPSAYLERQYGVDKGASPKIVWQAARDFFQLVFEVYRFRKSLKTR